MKNLYKVLINIMLIIGLVQYAHADQIGQADKRWRGPVALVVNLPTVGNNDGDIRYVTGTNQVFAWDAGTTTWLPLAGSGVGDLVSVSVADTVAGYLGSKIASGDAISTTILTPAGNEQLEVNVLFDNSTIGLNGSNQLYVKDAGITALKLNSDTAGDGLSLDGVTNALTVNVDGATIVIATDTLEVPDGGITEPKLDIFNAPFLNFYLRWNGTKMEWASPTATMDMSQVRQEITQALHGFVVGDVLRWDSGTSTYVKAKADTATNAEAVGIVVDNVDINTFKIMFLGNISGLAGLVSGDVYFLSDVTAGALMNTAPTVVGHVSKPVLIATSATTGYFFNWRGVLLGNPVAPASPTFVVGSASGLLPNEEVLTAGSGISVTPAASTITVASTDTLALVTGRGALTTTSVQLQNVMAAEFGKDDATNTAGAVKFWSDGANNYYSTFTAGTQTANATYTLPTAMPTANDLALISSTAGVMSWNDQALLTTSSPTFAGITCDGSILPITDTNGTVGSASYRYGAVYAVNIHSGDVILDNGWRITEDWNGQDGVLLQSPTGKKYRIVKEEL